MRFASGNGRLYGVCDTSFGVRFRQGMRKVIVHLRRTCVDQIANHEDVLDISASMFLSFDDGFSTSVAAGLDLLRIVGKSTLDTIKTFSPESRV